jgi:prepilin-type N-terminal cleavage/methylation domain-containing protein
VKFSISSVSTLLGDKKKKVSYLLTYKIMERKNSGFTLIELLVVIVIIGILATISTATFSSYFGKARDAARTTSVSSMTLMIKVDGADVWDNTKYIYTDMSLEALFDSNDFRAQKGVNNICYFIGMAQSTASVGDDNEFVIATWGEEVSTDDRATAGVIMDGTTNAMDSIRGADPDLTEGDFSCTNPNFANVKAAFDDQFTDGFDNTMLYIDDAGAVGSTP